MKVTSAQNQFLKEIRRLKTKKGRNQLFQFVAEGFRFVHSLWHVQAGIEFVLYSESYGRTQAERDFLTALLEKNLFPVKEVSQHLFEDLCQTQSPQGILAAVNRPSWQWCDLISCQKPIVVLDRIQDPGNLGTLVRTADCADVGGIVLLKGSVDLFNDKVLRSTMGAIFSVPVLENMEWENVKKELSDFGYEILATSIHGDTFYDDIDYTVPKAIVIGNEAQGVSKSILSQTVKKIQIPNEGKSESLNAGVAGAVIMYETFRQRRKACP